MTDRAITIQHMIKTWNDQPDNATIEDRMGAVMDVALVSARERAAEGRELVDALRKGAGMPAELLAIFTPEVSRACAGLMLVKSDESRCAASWIESHLGPRQ